MAEDARRLERDLIWDEAWSDQPLEALRASCEHGLRVMWWNIEHGNTNKALEDRPVDQNLQRLLDSPLAPDVLALGEFQEGALTRATLDRLERRYPGPRYFEYGPRSPHRGILFLSTHPPISDRREPIDYVPIGASLEEAAAYKERWAKDYPEEIYFERDYLRFTIDHPAAPRRIHVVPLHTAQPWSKMQEVVGGIAGLVWAGLNIYFGASNPLMHQLERFRQELESDVLGSERGSTVVIGDLNLMRGGILETPAYRKVQKGLVDALRQNDRPTWPARSSKELASYPSFRIDHAFVSPDLAESHAEVLPLRGSDHYPIYVVAR